MSESLYNRLTARETLNDEESAIHSLEEAIEFAKQYPEGVIYIYPNGGMPDNEGRMRHLVTPIEVYSPQIIDETPDSLREVILETFNNRVNFKADR